MDTISSTEGQHMQQVDLTQLNIPQLSKLKQQLDQELRMFQDSLNTLKIAQTRFQESHESLESITPETEGKPVLVPLTGSMYVPGVLAKPDSAIIEIGTGYYAKKDIPGAKDYFKRRVKFVTEQMEKIQVMGLEKSRIRDTIQELMAEKMQANLQGAKLMQQQVKTE